VLLYLDSILHALLLYIMIYYVFTCTVIYSPDIPSFLSPAFLFAYKSGKLLEAALSWGD